MSAISKFAPPEKNSDEEIRNDFDLIHGQTYLNDLFNAIASAAVILNSHRQIVFANQNFLEILGLDRIEPILGKRPGETINCINSMNNTGGCGTSENCRVCGAVNAILASQKGHQRVQKDALITSKVNEITASWDLMVTAHPISIEFNTYTVLTLQDISHSKRKLNMERVFFHDIYNSVGGVNGLINLVKNMDNKNDGAELINLSYKLSQQLLEEISSYRYFALAEKGELELDIQKLNTNSFLKDMVDKIRFHKVADNKLIEIDPESSDIFIKTDPTILSRIVLNMLKNALEATIDGYEVKIGAALLESGRLRFWVHNVTYIVKDIQMQIFQRSFSTKGKNRGIGTYSIKLLGEKYLKGKVGFTTDENKGTVFYIDLPLELSE
ncbi:MAG: PAS domain-containing sensor histidine kinase [Candidatus Cyclobacteriaceae bacterium M3_2C_046]